MACFHKQCALRMYVLTRASDGDTVGEPSAYAQQHAHITPV